MGRKTNWFTYSLLDDEDVKFYTWHMAIGLILLFFVVWLFSGSTPGMIGIAFIFFWYDYSFYKKWYKVQYGE